MTVLPLSSARGELVHASMGLWRVLDTDDTDVMVPALIRFDDAATAYAQAKCNGAAGETANGPIRATIDRLKLVPPAALRSWLAESATESALLIAALDELDGMPADMAGQAIPQVMQTHHPHRTLRRRRRR